MRGQGISQVFRVCDIRITPAYAGKRVLVLPYRALTEDHPRVCGEKMTICSACTIRPGSPPRMRGKAAKYSVKASDIRITPAYAGKSIIISATDIPREDHPRVCGEKPRKKSPRTQTKGSPPRMRGKARWGG